MSADNWRVCPRCIRTAQAKREKKTEEAAAAYGKVSREEWLRMTKESQPSDDEPEDTFREDYEIGTNAEGKFFVSYSGRCTACGLTHRYKFEMLIPLATGGEG